MVSKPKRKFSNHILKPDLQIGFALTFSLSIFFSGAVYISLFYQLLINYYDTSILPLVFPPESANRIQTGFHQLLVIMFVFLFIFTTVTFLMAIRLSHRFVGPIHQLENVMKKTIETGEITEVHFRPNDFFLSLAKTFNQYTKVLQRKD